MTERPIRIAGAGVAGLMAAIRLAQGGARVEVSDRGRDSGAGHPARFDAIENWTTASDLAELRAAWGLDLPLRRPEAFEVFDRDGHGYVAATRRPLVYVVRRGLEPGSLEQALKRQALELGVRLRYRAPLPREDADLWAVGARAPGRFVAAGLGFLTSHPDVVRVLVDRRLTPNAYAYLIVVDGQATLSVVLTRHVGHARHRLNEAVGAFQRIRPFDMHDIRAGGGTGGLIEAFRRPSAGPLTLGEAAGFQDYLWGFGIRHALGSGDLAARSILEGVDYGRLVAREIRPLVESSLALRVLYDHVGDRVDRQLMRRLASSADPAGILRRAYGASAIRTAVRPFEGSGRRPVARPA